MSPGAGEELKHLLSDVKSKAAKPETLSPNDEGSSLKPKALNLKDEGHSPKDKGLNLKALGDAVKDAKSRKQTIATWSPEVSAVLWYLKKTTPEFSISDEVRSILEKGLQRKYPDLYKAVIEEMKKGN
jgi:hypothetical protein